MLLTILCLIVGEGGFFKIGGGVGVGGLGHCKLQFDPPPARPLHQAQETDMSCISFIHVN